MLSEDTYSRYSVQTSLPQLPPWLQGKSRRLRVAKGEEIMTSDQEMQYIYLVISGCVIIYNRCVNGSENRVVVVPEGSIIGEIEALAGLKQVIYSARAYVNSTLLRVPTPDFLKWVHEDGEASWGMTQLLAEKLLATSMQSSEYGALDAKGRLAQLLLRLGEGRVRLTRQELAGACSVSLRTINRCVKEFRDAGLLDIERGKIEVTQDQLTALENELNAHAQ